MRAPLVCALSIVIATSCGAPARAPEPAPSPSSRTELPTRLDEPTGPPAAASTGEPVRDPAPEAKKLSEQALFPPKDFPPPSEKSAAPGDGHWTQIGDAALGERAAKEP